MRRSFVVAVLVAMALVAEVAAARPPHIDRNADDLRLPKEARGTPRAPAPPKAELARKSRRERERYRGPGARDLPTRSRSVGLPFEGRLLRAVHAEPNDFLRYTGEYTAGDNFWGTWELVQLIERAAYRVHQRAPGAKLSIGELSAHSGGDIEGHASHENGRDADLAFYMLDGRGRPVEPYGFAEFRADGTARPPNEGLVFDDIRNYELVKKLLTDGDARVQYIFVAQPIKRRILAEARRQNTSASVLERMETAMVQPAAGDPHRDHFHVRIYCAPADRPACEDRSPFHAWYPGTPPATRASLPGIVDGLARR